MNCCEDCDVNIKVLEDQITQLTERAEKAEAKACQYAAGKDEDGHTICNTEAELDRLEGENEDLQERCEKAESEASTYYERSRKAAEIIITEIGPAGPENGDHAAMRAVHKIRELKTICGKYRFDFQATKNELEKAEAALKPNNPAGESRLIRNAISRLMAGESAESVARDYDLDSDTFEQVAELLADLETAKMSAQTAWEKEQVLEAKVKEFLEALKDLEVEFGSLAEGRNTEAFAAYLHCESSVRLTINDLAEDRSK